MATESLHQTIAILQRTPAVLNALLRDLPEALTSAAEGPGTWSAFDIVVSGAEGGIPCLVP